MAITTHAFFCPKDDHYPHEYEDAVEYSIGTLRFAVADGASETSFAREWAGILTAAYVRGHLRPPSAAVFIDSLRSLQQTWRALVPWQDLAWYALEKAEAGAFATILGVEIQRAGTRRGMARWSAIAVGDSCMFHIRAGGLMTAFPIDDPGLFGSTPVLVPSNPAVRDTFSRYIVYATGRLRRGDHLLLMTDALAHWFLREHAANRRPSEDLDSVTTQLQFHSFIRRLRDAGRIRPDDTTLLRIVIGPRLHRGCHL